MIDFQLLDRRVFVFIESWIYIIYVSRKISEPSPPRLSEPSTTIRGWVVNPTVSVAHSWTGKLQRFRGVGCSNFMIFFLAGEVSREKTMENDATFLGWIDNLNVVAFEHEHTKDPSHLQRSHNHLGSRVAWISCKGRAPIFTEYMFDVSKMICYLTVHSAGLDDRHGLRQSYAQHSSGTTSISCRKIEE